MAASVFAVVAGSGILGGLAISLVGLGFVFLIHELGHLLAAKACGVKFSKYYLGFHTASDPQSLAAKAVWQRVLIIAAGSVLNLLLAVAVAAVAYRLGVSCIPCVLGGAVAGDPAWALGLRPGDKILQVGRSGRPNERLRFDKDLITAVSLHGTATELEMLVRRYGQQQPEWISIRPSDRLRSLGRPATLGVYSASTTRLAEAWPPPGDRTADAGGPALLADDEIVAVNGVPLPRDEQTGEILGHHLEAALAQHMTEPLALTVLRRAEATGAGGPVPAQKIDVVMTPARRCVLGLAMQLGPIVAVRVGGPADTAGFRAGDVILSINGQEVGDPLTLAQRLLPMVGKQIEVAVRRGEAGLPVALRVTPQPPTTYQRGAATEPWLAVDALGVALRVANRVQSVDSSGPAFRGGLRVGDEITEVRFQVSDASPRRTVRGRYGPLLEQRIDIGGESPNWPYADACLQLLGADVEVAITYRRWETIGTARISPVESLEWFRADRGLLFEPLRQVDVADSWTAASVAAIGHSRNTIRETLTVLQRLVSGHFGVENVGGPIAVVGAGRAEASQGSSRLLLFLAFASINFAVLCWLPIPGLDGGHLLFLVVEGLRGKPMSNKLQLILIVVFLIGPALAIRTVPVTCLSQLVRLISLIRVRGAARPDAT